MSKAVSYSRMSTHDKCGLKYKYSYIDKLPNPFVGSPAVDRGNRLHDSAENYVLTGEQLDPELEFYRQWLFSLRENYDCHPERKWGLTDDYQQCDFDSVDALLRGIWDLLVIPSSTSQFLDVFEYKSGKIYDEHKKQRYLYGLAALIHFPEFDNVKVSTVYFDQQKTHHDIFTKNNLASMKGHYKTKLLLMGMETTWVANPSYSCRWCNFAKDNGGPCSFG